MSFNSYLYEKSVAARHAEIRHDVQLSRIQAHARQRPTLVRYATGKLGTFLVELGSRLQRISQQSEAYV